ncbi:FMRFamide-activated amiloride-sensitive sodium channel [Schistosoma japonicum]|uniref:FMRFamide-activated amiloride-sensitive sodium channel n=1 Tax=Schistosoma japonicum TaxID=6182 RepID=A0A4Z2DM13_SCHJA|nr:FMRFamide-activated amiloride-sensitive sodium channel [Schistosoma japonicum]
MPSNSTFPGSSCKDVLQSFCRWTSVRGLQHLVRSEHPLLRTIWAIFVGLMCIANIGLVTLLLIHYYQFNTIENIRTLRGIPVAFPHITLCNVDPVNSYRVYCLQNPKSKYCNINPKYSNILTKYQEANRYFKTYKGSTIWHKLEDPSMVAIFYQLIGMEAAIQIGHQIDDFIIPIFCEVTTREKGGILMKRKCEEAGIQGLHLITYKYFNCYTLSMEDTHISYNAVRLSMILYLDEEEDLNCRPYCTHEFTEWAGSKIVVHSPTSYPDIEASGMNLLPGASNQILIDGMHRIEKKNMKSKPCENNARNFSIIYFDHSQQQFNQRTIGYTDTLCIQLLIQTVTMEQCQCIDFLMPIPGIKMNLVNKLPFCGNLSRSNVNESLDCSQQVRQNNSIQFRNLCPISCLQMQYNYELTQLRWPQKPRILNYYTQLKDRFIYNQKFDIYEKINKISMINATEALIMLQHTDIFEKNFLHVDVNRPNFDTLMSYRENEEYTLPTLLSQIGGICTICKYSIYNLIMKIFKLKHTTSMHTTNNNSKYNKTTIQLKSNLSKNFCQKYENHKHYNKCYSFVKDEIQHMINTNDYNNDINYLKEMLFTTNINNNNNHNDNKLIGHSYIDSTKSKLQNYVTNNFIQIHEPDDNYIIHLSKSDLCKVNSILHHSQHDLIVPNHNFKMYKFEFNKNSTINRFRSKSSPNLFLL